MAVSQLPLAESETELNQIHSLGKWQTPWQFFFPWKFSSHISCLALGILVRGTALEPGTERLSPAGQRYPPQIHHGVLRHKTNRKVRKVLLVHPARDGYEIMYPAPTPGQVLPIAQIRPLLVAAPSHLAQQSQGWLAQRQRHPSVTQYCSCDGCAAK